MITTLKTIEANKRFILEHGGINKPFELLPIDFIGIGWYSKSDDGIYRKGTFATYSRIRIQRNLNCKMNYTI